jgi:hypothetical protein
MKAFAQTITIGSVSAAIASFTVAIVTGNAHWLVPMAAWGCAGAVWLTVARLYE